MQCDCRKEFEEKIADVLKKDLPEGWERFDANLNGYVLAMPSLEERLTIRYEGEVYVPKKAGGLKRQKVSTSIQVRYCPFCGEKAATESKE
ncbi:hypothetical protein ACUN8C_05745 [Kushneria sp. Sum13]|uniref:hypothetical protein n=1 Tax=Kushneria sp. Sum13 TaxID=3459196 RepID=UPI004045D0D5